MQTIQTAVQHAAQVAGNLAQSAGQAMYEYWIVGPGVAVILGIALRSRIARQWQRMMLALRHTKSLVHANESLVAQLRESEARADDWRERFEDLERRYEAFKDEVEHRHEEFRRKAEALGEEMAELGKRMTSAEKKVELLRLDRDDLVTHSRLLTGQMVTAGMQPDYPAPALRSIIAVPSPTHPPDPGAPH